MGKIWTAGMRAAALGLGMLAIMAAPVSGQELSERAVRTFMDYAWTLTPAKFTKPDGTSVEIDKKNRQKVEVPMDTAREVIKVGRMTAHAQMCELPEDQIANYHSLMRREEAKGKWTEQQIIYINQLHLTTVMLLTGNIKLVEKTDGGKDVVIDEPEETEANTCTDEQRKKVKELIAAYIATGPDLAESSTGSVKK